MHTIYLKYIFKLLLYATGITQISTWAWAWVSPLGWWSRFWVNISRHKPFNLLLYDSKLQISSSEAVSVKNSSNQKRTYSRTQNGCVESYRKKFLIRTSNWCWLGGALGQSNLKGISLNWSTWFRFNRFIRINKNEETWWKKRQSDRFQVRAFTVKSKMDRIQLFIKICH